MRRRRSSDPAPPKAPATPGVKRVAAFDPACLEDLGYWVETERKTALKVLELVREVLREPFTGRGKPEPLKGPLAGAWSRRITQEHRLVYIVKDDRVVFLQARMHY